MNFQPPTDPRSLDPATYDVGMRLAREAGYSEQAIDRMFEREAGTDKPALAGHIVRLCAVYGQTCVEEITGERRHREVVHLRQAATFLIYRHCKQLTRKRIADEVGYKDHSTVKHAVDRVSEDLDDYNGERFGAIVQHIEDIIGRAVNNGALSRSNRA